MGQPQSFDAIKILLAGLNAGQAHHTNDIALNTDNKFNYDDIYNERLNKFFSGYDELYRAAQNKDNAAIRAALAKAKIYTLSLTSFFTALEDDCISLLSRYGDGCLETDTAPQPHAGGSGVSV